MRIKGDRNIVKYIYEENFNLHTFNNFSDH